MAREAAFPWKLLTRKRSKHSRWSFAFVAQGSIEPPRLIVVTLYAEKLKPGLLFWPVGKAITLNRGIRLSRNVMGEMKLRQCGGAAMLGGCGPMRGPSRRAK